LAEQAVEMMDDMYRGWKENQNAMDPKEYRKMLKQGEEASHSDGVDVINVLNDHIQTMTGKIPKRERIVVLGSGWGAHSFLQSIDATKYEVVIVSPRNYFLHTPLLASSSVGTVEYRSITEVGFGCSIPARPVVLDLTLHTCVAAYQQPIRNVNPFADYLEATCSGVDPEKKVRRKGVVGAKLLVYRIQTLSIFPIGGLAGASSGECCV